MAYDILELDSLPPERAVMQAKIDDFRCQRKRARRRRWLLLIVVLLVAIGSFTIGPRVHAALQQVTVAARVSSGSSTSWDEASLAQHPNTYDYIAGIAGVVLVGSLGRSYIKRRRTRPVPVPVESSQSE